MTLFRACFLVLVSLAVFACSSTSERSASEADAVRAESLDLTAATEAHVAGTYRQGTIGLVFDSTVSGGRLARLVLKDLGGGEIYRIEDGQTAPVLLGREIRGDAADVEPARAFFANEVLHLTPSLSRALGDRNITGL